jgi:hypothetical protein
VLNSESIVIIRIKGEHLLYSTISGGMIGYGWRNVCYIVNFPPGEYILYSKVSGGKVYYIANIPKGNIPGEGLLCGRFTIRHRHKICTRKSSYNLDGNSLKLAFLDWVAQTSIKFKSQLNRKCKLNPCTFQVNLSVN